MEGEIISSSTLASSISSVTFHFPGHFGLFWGFSTVLTGIMVLPVQPSIISILLEFKTAFWALSSPVCMLTDYDTHFQCQSRG
jgi:hypothetical protein